MFMGVFTSIERLEEVIPVDVLDVVKNFTKIDVLDGEYWIYSIHLDRPISEEIGYS